MDTPIRTGPTTYANSFGKPIDHDIEKWFRYGVKPVGTEQQGGICSKRSTLYVITSVLCLVVILTIIIVPIVIGNITKSK